MKRDTIDSFVLKAKKIHGEKYDYSKSIYANQDTKITIICKNHGEFNQRPDHHLAGHHCKKCSTRNDEIIKKRLKVFLKKAKKIHKNKYEYDFDSFINAKTKIKIKCPIHGFFEQTPDTHLRSECKKCAINKTSERQRKTLSDFLCQANKKHNNYYDYSKSIYLSNKKNIEIICPKHGTFWQTPGNHIQGKGCPECKTKSKGEIAIKLILQEKKIKFKKEKRFSDCINPLTKKKLRFDFYLENFNCCIEYDGKQHFEKISIWNNNVEEYKYRDILKNEYCKNKNIKIFRINYKENVDKKMKEIFDELSII